MTRRWAAPLVCVLTWLTGSAAPALAVSKANHIAINAMTGQHPRILMRKALKIDCPSHFGNQPLHYEVTRSAASAGPHRKGSVWPKKIRSKSRAR